MNIAFLSYEYPQETGGGGIGTYLKLITKLLSAKGHSVTVFAGTKKKQAFWESEQVFRTPASSWEEFNKALPDYFLSISKERKIDVVECTDFAGCGIYIKKRVPGLPIVVRLHTPFYIVDRLLYNPLSFFQQCRFVVGSLIKRKWPRLPKPPTADKYENEFELIKLAERVCSPSYSIYKEMAALGFDLKNKTDFVPLPFDISNDTNAIKARPISDNANIIFIGRLEKRKGVIDLAKAIPKVLKVYPTAHFTFIGESSLSPIVGMSMDNYLKQILKSNLSSTTFSGKLPHTEIIRYLTEGDIFVFPSHYESFGIACCEAMAAGKAVIGSENGGMSEIIEHGKSGLLIKPQNAQLLADTICQLIEDNTLRLSLGMKAKHRIKSFLNTEKIVELQVACYQKAIAQSSQVK